MLVCRPRRRRLPGYAATSWLSPLRAHFYLLLVPQRRNSRRRGIVDYIGMQLHQAHDVLVARPASEAAFGGNAELRQILLRRGDAAPRAFQAVGIVDQPEIDFADALAVELRQRLEIVVVAALARHRHMDIVDSAAKLRCDRIADGDACSQIARLECVLVILAAVAKMVAELDVANHRVAKLD